MNINEKAKNILIDIVVVFVVPFGIFYFYQTLVPSAGLDSAQPGSELAGEGQKFLVKLNELNSLKLDTSVFESPVYKSLVDTSVPPPTEEKGRPHPFVPPAVAAPATVSSVPTAPSKGKSATALKNLDTLVGGR